MVMFINVFYYILFFVGLMSFVSNRKHLLLTLLCLEYIVLILYLYIFVFLNYMNYDYYYSMVFLTFSVCEGALGLSVLVVLIRTYGNDYFQTYNILQC